MKKSVIISLVFSFLFFFIGVFFIIWASLIKHMILMYVGLGSLLVGCIGYTSLIILFLFWYKKKGM